MANKKKSKLHEVLAVEGELESQSSKVMTEARQTFTKKGNHFMGFHKWLDMNDDNRKKEEEGATEHREVVETVKGKLDWVWKHFGRYLNAVAQKERTNQEARADLMVGDEVLIEAMPATLLLGLESRLKKLRDVYMAVPTHQPGVRWEADAGRGEEVFRAAELVTTQKQEKTIRHKVLVEATEHHPAQIDKWTENIVVGTFKSEIWTSTVSPAQKAEWLGRIDQLLRAVKRARQRANSTEVVSISVNNVLKNFIHKD